MTQFSTTEVNIVKSGTAIQDTDSGKELVVITDDDVVFQRGAVYVTATNWDRMNKEFVVRSHPPARMVN